MQWTSLESEPLTEIELAAEYIYRRSVELSFFINILENFYAIRGITPVAARKLALQSGLTPFGDS